VIIEQTFFDFWCRGHRQYEVYIADPRAPKKLTREDFHPEWEEARRGQGQQALWEKVGEWTFDWSGPFYLAAVGNDRFFVTDAGGVYVAPPAKPSSALKQLWNGLPVDVLINDDDAKTWYAFTKDQYFELADPIQPKPHSLAIERTWAADKAMATAVKCGRLIRVLGAPPLNDRTWDDLVSADPRVGGKAVWALTNEPQRAVALLKDRLKPVQVPPARELAALSADLGAENFAQREAAQKKLRDLGQTIEPNLRAASATADPERKRRLDQLLAECQRIDSRTPDELRAVRAVQALERIGTPEARRVLDECAKGADAALLTREARRALQVFPDR
jgi:hypothetical protein